MRANSIIRLLNSHGKSLNLTRNTTDLVYDTSSGTVSGGDAEPVTLKGYFYNNVSGKEDFSSTQYGQRKLCVLNEGITPKIGDTVSGYGDTVVILNVHPIMSGDSPIIFLCDLEE